MLIRMSVVAAGSRENGAAGTVEVLLDAPAGSTFGDVRRQLLEAAGFPSERHDATCLANGEPITESSLVGETPLVRGAVITVLPYAAGPAPRERAARALLELHVAGGPGAGRIIPISRGSHLIGRSADCDIRLDDAGVSRRHVRLEVSTDGVTVQEVEATNPSLHQGIPLPSGGLALRQEERLMVGSTTLVLRRSERHAAHLSEGHGVLRVHRPPRFITRRPRPRISYPTAPARPDHQRLPLLAALAPLVVSGILAWVMQAPAMLLFAVLSPVMMLGQWWSDRRHGRVSHRTALTAHRRTVEVVSRELAALLEREAADRRAAHPDLAILLRVASAPESRLWCRRPGDPDHLVLRVGTGTQPAETEVEGDVPEGAPALSVDDVPALVGLRDVGVLGISGPRARVLSQAAGLILQLATWQSPRDARLVVLTTAPDPEADWAWASRLPHAQPLAMGRCLATVASLAHEEGMARRVREISELVAQRRTASQGDAGSPRPLVVVVLDGARDLRRRSDVAELLLSGPALGIHWLCLDETADRLPWETVAHLALDTDTRPRAALRLSTTTVDDIVPDLPTPSWVERVSRSLAALEDATPQSGATALPSAIGFRDLHLGTLGVDPADPTALVRHWSGAERPRSALLGQSRAGMYAVDLVADGPHALVGGTTGAGKSELLRTLIASLSVAHRPDELSFVLVDYKGGAAFQDCSRLPHTVGLVTDLDEHLGARALTSLGAELKRRERLLADVGAKDFSAYHSTSLHLGPLPRLLLVVDEFKLLAEELPDFVDGLVRLAAVGRSLGVHLVLATQRPGGAVSGDMRANISLRVALRMRDRSDSDDVVEVPDAASISDRCPGRAWIRTAGLDLSEVQTAYVSGPMVQAEPSSRIPVATRLTWEDLGAEPPTMKHQDAPSDGPTELAAIVDAARTAASAMDVAVMESPWLPSLPALLPRSAVSTVPSDPYLVPLGLADRPAQQRQDVFCWDLDRGGHLGIAGGPRTGRTSTLRTLALTLAERHSPSDLHLHALHGAPGALRQLARLPHVGVVAGSGDLRRARRLVERLVDELHARQSTGRTSPTLVVLVDGWEALEEALESIEHGAPTEALLRVIRDGLSLGIRVAVTGGRAITTGRLSGLVQQRLLLGMPDPLDLALAGISPSDIPAHQGPGRAIDPRDGSEIQLACIAATPEEQDEAISSVAAASCLSYAALPPEVLPWRIEALPDRITLAELARPASPTLLAIGVGGDALEPVGFDLRLDPRHILVAGAPRSGRSTALLALARRLLEVGTPLAVITSRRSPLTELDGIPGVALIAPSEMDAFIALRRATPDLAILVDDAEQLDVTAIEPALLEAARLVDVAGGFIAAGVDLHRAASAYRGLVPELARHGAGLLLGARSPADGELFRVRVDPTGERHPGRGLLVAGGTATPVQVAVASAQALA